MTYGNPSMQSAVEKLLENQVEKIIVLPLYPQYSSTTTGALFDVLPTHSNTLAIYRPLNLSIPIIWINTILMPWCNPSKCG
ncbi:ferrochelatase [Rodentibacter pneumotropicus]|uniref:Ferrochelatase n=1 Tax=Rodentibacter pneumotropicus TaxID=758 RepID=A0A3S4W3I3_9PAST|nr:ferrochelatase [Rodentibacter pneumotropicus]